MNSITLLDSTTWKKADLLKEMASDDFYYNYLGKTTLSSSVIKKLRKSPKSYAYTIKYGDPITKALLLGRLLHLSVLEPEEFDKYTFVDCKSRTAKVFKDTVLQNKEKEHTIFTTKERSEIERLQDALFRNEQALKLLTNCEYEIPAIDYIEGIPFRGKADILAKGNRIVDLKTTSSIHNFANPRSEYSAYAYHYDIQVYIYCQLFKMQAKQFQFLVIDKQSCDIGIFNVGEEFYESGKRKTLEAIERYKMFFLEDVDLDSYTISGTL